MCVPLRIFVSYSHRDSAVVAELVADLRVLGHDVWYDDKLTGGDAWWSAILTQLRAVDLVVFVASNNACRSEACLREFGYAKALGGVVVPLLVDDAQDILPEAIRALQSVDYRADARKTLRHLAETLNGHGRALVRPRTLPIPAPQEPAAPYPLISELRDRLASQTLTLPEQERALDGVEACLKSRQQWNVAVDLLKMLRQRNDVAPLIAAKADVLLQSYAERRTSARQPLPAWTRYVLPWVIGWSAGIMLNQYSEMGKQLATALAVCIGIAGTLVAYATRPASATTRVAI